MKRFQLFFVLMVLSGVSPTIVAVTLDSSSNQSSDITKNTVKNEFGLSGKINQFDLVKRLIKIDGKRYNLSSKGNLTNDELKPNLKIKYNLEQSSSEKMGRITRIWIEEKEIKENE